jgi:hypothetical protein
MLTGTASLSQRFAPRIVEGGATARMEAGGRAPTFRFGKLRPAFAIARSLARWRALAALGRRSERDGRARRQSENAALGCLRDSLAGITCSVFAGPQWACCTSQPRHARRSCSARTAQHQARKMGTSPRSPARAMPARESLASRWSEALRCRRRLATTLPSAAAIRGDGGPGGRQRAKQATAPLGQLTSTGRSAGRLAASANLQCLHASGEAHEHSLPPNRFCCMRGSLAASPPSTGSDRLFDESALPGRTPLEHCQFALSGSWRLRERSGCGLRAQGFAGRSPLSGPDVQQHAESS